MMKTVIEFLKKNGVIILIALVVLFLLWNGNCYQTAIISQEFRQLEEQVESLKQDTAQRLERIAALDEKIEAQNEKLKDIDGKIDKGEERYSQLIAQIGNLNQYVNQKPETFKELAACQTKYNQTFEKFQLTIAALKQKETDFGLCIEKVQVLETKIILVESQRNEWETIANNRRIMYDNAQKALDNIKKQFKRKRVKSFILDTASVAGAGYLASQGKWKEAAFALAGRYVVKAVLKL